MKEESPTLGHPSFEELIEIPSNVNKEQQLNTPNEVVGNSKLLKEGVGFSSFIAFLFAAMMSIAGLVFINADQTYIMVDILDYPRRLVGTATGNLVLADELLSVFMVSVWGALSDRISRRWIFSSGLLLMALATALHPWARSVFPDDLFSFFTSMVAFRLLFALGASAATAMMTAIIGDYSKDSSRAKVAGITGFATGLGALFAALVLSRLPVYIMRDSTIVPGNLKDLPNGGASLVITFAITGTLLLLASITSGIFLRTPIDFERRNMPLLERIKIGVTAMKHPVIALAYASGYVARADSIALTLFVAPWVDNYLTSQGLCPPRDPDALTRCLPAKKLASSLMSIAHTTMLLGAPIFGMLSDRLGPVSAISIPAMCGMIAFSVLYNLRNPQSLIAYIAMGFAGLADIGMIISSMALIANVSEPRHRGALAGVYSFFGALGIVITSKIGGILFDGVRETAAFGVVALPSGIVMIAAGFIMIRGRNKLDPPRLA